MIFFEDDFSVLEYRRLKAAADNRAFCPNGEGGGVTNSCSSAEAIDSSWKQATGRFSTITWDKETLAEKTPIKGGSVLESITVKGAGNIREAQKNVPLTLTEIVALGGGAVRGATVVVSSSDPEDIEVSHLSPIDPSDPDAGSIESSVEISHDPTSSQTALHFGTLFPVETTLRGGEQQIAGDKDDLTDQQKTRIASVMMERVVSSLSIADEAGFAYADMLAVGGPGDSDKGYRLWPQFGFDGYVQKSTHEKIRDWASKNASGKGDDPPAWAADLLESIEAADSSKQTLTIQELISSREGERWWDDNGSTIDLTLNLQDKESKGYKRFEKMRAKLGRLKKRNEGRSADEWLAALFVDVRATCERLPGGLFAPGNDCAAGSGSPAPRSDDYLASGDDDIKSFTPGELSDSPPVTGGNVLRAFEVENVATVAEHFSSGSGVSDMDKLMKIAGGVRRGGEVDVSGFTDSVRVHNEMPISPRGDKSQGTVSTSIAIASDDDGEYVYYADLSLVPPTTGDWTIGSFPPGYDKKVASLAMERMAESLSVAEECGLVRADTYAAGNKSSSLKGYRLWPQFGFDGTVPDHLKPRIPSSIVPGDSSLSSLTVQQLISTREGEKWWDENGDGFGMSLSFLDKESLGYKRYSAAKAKVLSLKKRNEGRAFCPTGDGGGVDNSCGSDAPSRGSFPKSFPAGSEKFIEAVDSVSPDPASVWDRSRGRAETPSPRILTEAADEQEAATGGMTPEAEKSYSSLVDEIGRQYEALTAAGLRARAWRGQGEPYGDPPGSTKPNSDKMREEVAKTGEFSFFMTENGFGTGSATPDHPMLRETKYKTADGEPMIANDLFRVVHDMVAHVRGGYSFSTNGEFNGMLTHASTLPESAWPALFAETFGQNAVYEKTGNYAQQNAYASRLGPAIIKEELKKRKAKRDASSAVDNDEPLGYQHLKVRPWLMQEAPESRGDAKAPPKDRIKGSDVNEEGSAKNQSGDIALDEGTISALKAKAEEHNAAMRKRGRPDWTHVRLPALKSVYRRGAGAFSTSHRPGMTRDRWAMARVNAFLYLARRGRPENSKYVGDNDLLNSGHPKHSKQSRSADCGRDQGGRFGDGNKCQIGININDSQQDFTGQILAGEKTIETRPTDSLRPYVGKTVGIVRTGKGKATLVGTMKVGEPKFYKSKEEFDADSDKHRVTKGSPYYIGKGGKYGYPLTEVTKVKPKELDSKGIIARVIGRSYGHDEIEYAFDEESRAFCPTGDGGGVDNSCGSQPRPRSDTWQEMSGGAVSWKDSDIKAGPPVTGGDVMKSFRIENPRVVAKALDGIADIDTLDDVIAIAGGVRRGAEAQVFGDGNSTISVFQTMPIASDGSGDAGHIEIEVTMLQDDENGSVVSYDGLFVRDATRSEGGEPYDASSQIASVLMQRMTESLIAAEENQFDEAYTRASGNKYSALKGYRLWPQFGFDGVLGANPRELVKDYALSRIAESPRDPNEWARGIVDHIESGRDLSIQELISTREGERCWDEAGTSVSLTLDFSKKDSLGYKRFEKMKNRLARLRERNKNRSGTGCDDEATEFRNFVALDVGPLIYEPRAFCATGDGGGVKNDCSSAEPGSAVAEVKAAKQRNVDVMIGGGKRVAVMDSEARDRAIADFKQHPKSEGSAAGSTTDLWDREFVTRPEGSNKISESDPVFPKETLRQSGQYVAHEAVGQYLSMRHEEERAAAGGTGPGNIIDLSNPDVDERQVDYVADALAEDAMHAYEVLQVDPGFYSTDLEKTMATMESRHPELASDENSKFIFTSLLAITSSGQGPDANLADADGLYRMWKEHGTVVPSSYGGGSRDVTTSLRNFQSLVDSFGIDRTRNLLSGYAPASRVAKTFKTLAEKSGDPNWRERTGSSELNLPKPLQATGELKDEVVPLFSVFGPKIGSFHANLSGRHDFLTMDRWLMRSVGRVTGDLVTRSTPEQAKARAKSALDAIASTKWKKSYLFGTDESHGITKEALVRSFKIQQQTGVIEENGAAFAWATAAERSHQKTRRPSGGGYGRHEDDTVHSLHQAGNSLFKSLIHEQQDPRTGTARSNIRTVFRKMQDKIESKTGRRPDVDEIQAALWQYEKRLWKHLGAKTNIEDNSLFSSAADGLVSGRITQRKYSPASKRDLQQMEDADVAFDLHHFDAEQSAWTSDFVESGVDFVELMSLLESDLEESRNFAALDYGTPVPLDIERRAFCATGEGNGVDNSCSSSEGGMFGDATDSNDKVTWGLSSRDKDSPPPFRGADALSSVSVSAPKQIAESLSEIKVTPIEAVQIAGGRDGASVFMRPAPEFSEEPPFSGSGVTPVLLDLEWDAAGLENAVSGSAVIGASPKKTDGGTPEIVASLSTITASDAAKADPAKRQTLAREFYRTMVASVESAKKAGVSRIVFNAAGNSGKGPDTSWKGYTIWPRMGFDAPIPQHLRAKLPEELSHAKSLLDLHATPDGTRWWAKNGEDIDMSLSLKDRSSPQNQIMEKFIKRFSVSRRDGLSEDALALLDELWQEVWDEGILDDYEWDDGNT